MANSLPRSFSSGRAPSVQLSTVSTSPLSGPSLELLKAAYEGNATAVGTLLEEASGGASFDINVRGEGHMGALHLAAEGNHLNVVTQLLLVESVDINAQDEFNRTPLMAAAQAGHAEVVQALQEAGANVILCAQGGYTPLHAAALFGHIEVVNRLLGISGPIGFADFLYPPEMKKKNPKSMNHSNKLFKRSSESPKDRPPRKLRYCSMSYGGEGKDSVTSPEKILKLESCKSLVLKMLEAKTSAELFTPLHLAAGNGYQEVMVSLVHAYAHALGITEVFSSVQEKGGKEAINLVRTSIIQILNSQADIASEDEKSGVLDKALDRIVAQECDAPSLSWATIEALVSYVNDKDCVGRTPLHFATWEQHVGVVETLLELYIVNVNATDMDGFTPLHLGCKKGCNAVVELLLGHDAKSQTLKPNLRARQNKATRVEILEVRRLQQKWGTFLFTANLQDFYFAEERDGMTALHYAVEGDNEDIVGALADHSDIDIFAVANSPINPSAKEVTESGPGEENCQIPLRMAFTTKNRNVLLKLLKSGKRNKIMQDLQMLRGYFSRSAKFEGNKKNVKDYHRNLLKTGVSLIRLDLEIRESDLFSSLETELGVALNTLLHKPSTNKYTLLHHAAFAGLSLELEMLLSIPEVANEINAVDVDSQTALHFATMEEEIDAVKVLINDTKLKPNEEDRYERTALQCATEKGSRDVVSVLMECPDVKQMMKKLFRERGVNDNAANTILVVAALIASVTFGGWLQPPLGFVQYTNVSTSYSTPNIPALSFAAVQYEPVFLFWVFNSVAFYFAMATVLSGAAEVLPMRDTFIGQEVRMVRGGLVRTSVLLILSIICVLCAFAAAGYACLPPLTKERRMMFWVTLTGLWFCFCMLCIFFFRVGNMLITTAGHHQLKWLRWEEEDLMALPAGKFLWWIFKLFNLIPDNYRRFDSSKREEEKFSCKRKIFWSLVTLFRLDRE